MEQQAPTTEEAFRNAQRKFGIEPGDQIQTDTPGWARQPLGMAKIHALAELGDTIYRETVEPRPGHMGVMLARLASMPGLPPQAAGYLMATAAGCFAVELRVLVEEGRSPTGTIALVRLIQRAISRVDSSLAEEG